MNKEDKELLLRDLCARLPYGVKCKVSYNSGAINDKDATLYSIDKDGYLSVNDFREHLLQIINKINEIIDYINGGTNGE